MEIVRIGSEVGSLSSQKLHTGIQRVAVELHKNLHKYQSSLNFRINPYLSVEDHKSDNFKQNSFISQDPVLNSTFVKIDELDILILADLNWRTDFGAIINAKKSNPNLQVVSVIYDILPMNHPEWFEGDPKTISTHFRIFLQKILRVSDLVIVNTNKVLQDILQLNWNYSGHFKVINLGSFSPHLLRVPHPIRTPNTMLTVGTVEPRKGQSDLLDAYDALRKNKFDIRFFIVGHYGWNSEKLINRIHNHPDYGGRLRWFRGISDEELSHLYQISTFSVAASYDEGFGLNIEESLRHGIPVLARQIEAFTERSQNGIEYFAEDNSNLPAKIVDMCRSNLRPTEKIRTMEDFAREFISTVLESYNSK